MLEALCSIGFLSGFIQFLKVAVFAVGYISGSNLFPEPLTAQEEKIYLEQLKSGDEEARNILIERNLRLVAHVVKKYANTKVEQDDLISIGTIGLIKGINSFNVEKGSKLSTYVSRCIDNEILMYLRSTKKLNAEVYLNEPIGKDKDDNVVTLQEVLENNDRNIEEEVDLKMKIKKLYKKMGEVLKDRERTIIELRFGLDGRKPKTQHEIADMMGISRSYVSRIETKAIGKLGKEFQE
ncbi:MAG: RNA polymerase sporulation sigma factor SigK [Clostridia bacterium]|nr:RNA polymerase sporulation sigma factor SigK [bacterium]